MSFTCKPPAYSRSVVDKWLFKNTNLNKETINEKIKRKEWWLNGEEAFKYGVVDKILW